MARLGKKRIIFLAAVAVVIIVIVVVMANKNGTSKTSVQTILTGKQGIIETVTATGKIEPRTRVKISADVAAKITFLGVKEGDWVEKGDLLLGKLRLLQGNTSQREILPENSRLSGSV